MWKKLLLVIVAVIAWNQWPGSAPVGLYSPITHAVVFTPEFPDIDQEPEQADINDSDLQFRFGDFRIRPLATFALSARVLASKHYRSGREARLSPVDLALGWGPMSDSAVLEAIDIRQSGRFYFWQTENPPIPLREIAIHSANMHLIPANPEIEKKIRRLKTGDQVRLKGYLVNIEASDGWRWRSSLTRRDTGAGACEIVLVETLL